MKATSSRSGFTKICCFNMKPIHTTNTWYLTGAPSNRRVPANPDHCRRSIRTSSGVAATNGAPSLPPVGPTRRWNDLPAKKKTPASVRLSDSGEDLLQASPRKLLYFAHFLFLECCDCTRQNTLWSPRREISQIPTRLVMKCREVAKTCAGRPRLAHRAGPPEQLAQLPPGLSDYCDRINNYYFVVWMNRLTFQDPPSSEQTHPRQNGNIYSLRVQCTCMVNTR